MEVTIARHAGYCFGVKKAMDCAEALAQSCKPGETLYTYGPLIHNKLAIKKLEEAGVRAIEDIEEIEETSGVQVIIRAHGVPPEVYVALEEKGVEIIDCTCPYVKKIHKIVNNADCGIIIIGDNEHPEIKGIHGWAGNNTIVVSNENEAEKLPGGENKISVVVQTTFNHIVFERIEKIILEKYPNAIICNTTCLETEKRQREAVELSKACDIMLVIGDRNSANSKKLYELCKKNCDKTLFLESIYDLELNNFKFNDRIGITAGASALPETLKEVAQYMSELEKGMNEAQEEKEVQNNEESQSFEDMLNDSLVSLHTGDVVKGTVISVINEEVSVNLGYKSDGIIERGEFSSDPSVVPANEVQIGDSIEVYVLRVNDGEGNVLLSKKRLESQKNMEFVEKAFESGEIIEVKVIDVVKAGLIALYKGIRVFIPYSQVSNRFVEDISVYKGSTLNIKILELDKSKRRIVGGRKELAKQEEEAKRAEVFGKLAVGDKVTGTVSRLVTFGAFVDLGGVDGLIHISQMTWGSIKNPKEILKEGQTVSAIVLDVNEEKGKIGLSLKDVNEDPWKNVEEKYTVGEIIEGKVARLAPFGAFIELEDGVDGLVHISQISPKRIEKCEDVLTVGETISVKIIDVNPEKRKISLSKKEADFSSRMDEMVSDGQDEADEVSEDKLTAGVPEVAETEASNEIPVVEPDEKPANMPKKNDAVAEPEEPAAEASEEVSASEPEKTPVETEE